MRQALRIGTFNFCNRQNRFLLIIHMPCEDVPVSLIISIGEHIRHDSASVLSTRMVLNIVILIRYVGYTNKTFTVNFCLSAKENLTTYIHVSLLRNQMSKIVHTFLIVVGTTSRPLGMQCITVTRPLLLRHCSNHYVYSIIL